MKNLCIFLLKLIIIICTFCNIAFGKDAPEARVVTADYLYWIDTTNALSASNVINGGNTNQWQSLPLGKTSFGSNTGTLWLRLNLANLMPGRYYHCFDFSLLNSVNWFIEKENQITHVAQAGISLPYTQYSVPFHKPCAAIEISSQPETLYIKVHARGPLDFSSSLYSSSQFVDWKHYWATIDVGFLACIFVTLAQFIFLFSAFKKRVFLYFGGHVFFMFINANVYSGSILLFLDNSPFLVQRLQPLSGAFAYLFMVLIVKAVLSEYSIPKPIKKVLNLILYIIYSCFPVSFIFHPAADAWAAINCIFICISIIGILGYFSLSKLSARYALVGFLTSFVTMIVCVLKAFGIVNPHSIIEIFPHLGLISESLFLGFAVLSNTSDMTNLIAVSNAKLLKMNEALQKEIEERNKIEIELAKERKRAIDAARFKSIAKISGNIAHEINTPLSIISFKTQNLLMALKNSSMDLENLRKEIGSIVKLVNRTSEIVQCIRMLGRDSSKEPVVMIPLSNLFKEVLALYEQTCKRAKIKVEITGLHDNLNVRARNAGLFQIFSNLLSNAIDALNQTPESQERLIKIDINTECGRLQVAISNNGVPIAPAIKEQIFEPFFSTKPGGVGVGLGLSLSQEIAANHEGTLVLDTFGTTDETRFVLNIPN